MATLITRAGKGALLTSAEIDANFNGLNVVVSTSTKGLAPQAPNDANQYLAGDGNWKSLLPLLHANALLF